MSALSARAHQESKRISVFITGYSLARSNWNCTSGGVFTFRMLIILTTMSKLSTGRDD